MLADTGVGDPQVLLLTLDADEVVARLQTGHPGRTGTQEGVHDGAFVLGNVVHQAGHQLHGLDRGMQVVDRTLPHVDALAYFPLGAGRLGHVVELARFLNQQDGVPDLKPGILDHACPCVPRLLFVRGDEQEVRSRPEHPEELLGLLLSRGAAYDQAGDRVVLPLGDLPVIEHGARVLDVDGGGIRRGDQRDQVVQKVLCHAHLPRLVAGELLVVAGNGARIRVLRGIYPTGELRHPTLILHPAVVCTFAGR